MTQLLEKACNRLTELPELDQDAIASLILEEIEDEERWNASFARPESIALLSQMAAEALAEHRAGKTLPLDPDNL